MYFFSTLTEAKLLKGYKRFLADVIFKNGEIKTVYCPNPGAMLGLKEKNIKIWLEKSKNKNSKYEFIWRLVEKNPGEFICIDTQIANKIIYESLLNRKIPELSKYEKVITEPKINKESRLDFLLESSDENPCYVEVKSITLSRYLDIAEFPDSITKRGSKHLDLLTSLKKKGFKTVQIYLIQRSNINFFKIAGDIDNSYYKSFQVAKNSGVEILLLQSIISKDGIKLCKKRPILL